MKLPRKMKMDSLGFETQSAHFPAEAFQDYGVYIVDDTARDVYAIVTEGPFNDEFKKNWGFSFVESNKNTPWSREMDRFFLNLHVFDSKFIYYARWWRYSLLTFSLGISEIKK